MHSKQNQLLISVETKEFSLNKYQPLFEKNVIPNLTKYHAQAKSLHRDILQQTSRNNNLPKKKKKERATLACSNR